MSFWCREIFKDKFVGRQQKSLRTFIISDRHFLVFYFITEGSDVFEVMKHWEPLVVEVRYVSQVHVKLLTRFNQPLCCLVKSEMSKNGENFVSYSNNETFTYFAPI